MIKPKNSASLVLQIVLPTLGLLLIIRAYELLPQHPRTVILLVTVIGIQVIAIFFGRWPALAASVCGALLYEYLYEPPVHSFDLDTPEGMITFVAVLISALVTSQLAIVAKERAAEAVRRRLEAERLYDFGQALMRHDTSEALACAVVDELVNRFEARGSAFHFAGNGATKRAGPEAESIGLATLVDVSQNATIVIDQTDGLAVVPVSLADSAPIAAIGALHSTLSPLAMRAIAHIAGTALERVRHGEAILDLARDIQMGFLPKRLPSFAGAANLDVFVYIKPMYEVGGDFYNLAPIDEQRLFFTIGDVADKGIPAALFMARAVTAFDISKGTGKHVHEAMSAVNRTLCTNNESRMFTTAMAAVIDATTGEIEYCDGGHEPPFVVRADGRVELIEKRSGLALGFLPDFSYFTARLKLDPGDALIFYTDGITEAMDAKRNLFGGERIQRTLEEVSSAPSETIGRGLLERVQSFVGAAAQSDDRTLVIVRYIPRQTDRTDLPEEIKA